MFERGSPVTDIVVEVRESDGLSYSVETTYCSTSVEGVLQTLSCEVPVSHLVAEPYNIPYGSQIYAKV